METFFFLLASHKAAFKRRRAAALIESRLARRVYVPLETDRRCFNYYIERLRACEGLWFDETWADVCSVHVVCCVLNRVQCT